MTSNVGLATPRGSGTSGYIQRNLSTLKPRATGFGAPYPPQPHSSSSSPPPHQQRQPDAAILSHDRLRQIEIQIFDLRDQLEEKEEEEEEEGSKLGEEEIERRCEELRKSLVEEWEREKNGNKGGTGGKGYGKGGGRGLKPHQVHELAEAKIKESERLRVALGIGEGREGRVWDDGGNGDRRRRKGEEGRGYGGREEKGERVGERERDRSSIKRERDSTQK